MQLEQPHLCLVARGIDPELVRVHAALPVALPIADRGELEALLGRLLESRAPTTAKTLDLVGHSTADKLLSIGDWVIDGDDRAVIAFFRELAENEVLPRLGIYALRLIGSLTGATMRGMTTMRTLARLLGIEVYGTTELIYTRQLGPCGFAAPESLVASGDDPTSAHPPLPNLSGHDPRCLEVDALPGRRLVPGERVVVASRDHAHVLLQLIARHAGVAMPGLLAAPYCELALPSMHGELFHRLDVLLAGEYVRTYPGGPAEPGVVYPVRDPHATLEIVDQLRP